MQRTEAGAGAGKNVLERERLEDIDHVVGARTLDYLDIDGIEISTRFDGALRGIGRTDRGRRGGLLRFHGDRRAADQGGCGACRCPFEEAASVGF